MSDKQNKGGAGSGSELNDLIYKSRQSNYTKEERIKRLYDIYDHSLDYVAKCITNNIFKGTSAALNLMERTRAEVMGQESMASGGVESGAVEVGFDIPGLEVKEETQPVVDA